MRDAERGYAMAALLVGLSVMAIMLSVALPVWQTAARREREAELIFRGEQYAHAIALYSRRNGGYPPSLDVLEKGRFLRKRYKDPVAGETDFQPVFMGQIIGGQPVAPRQPGGVGTGGGAGAVGQAGQPAPPGPRGQGARAGQPLGQGLGQPLGQTPGQPGAVGGGPLIGVVSRSTSESLRLYNGRGRYSEWVFVATAMTQEAGAPGGAQTPGMPGPGTPGRGGQRGAQPGMPRGGIGGRAPFPGPSGPATPGGSPFGMPGLPPPAGTAPQRP